MYTTSYGILKLKLNGNLDPQGIIGEYNWGRVKVSGISLGGKNIIIDIEDRGIYIRCTASEINKVKKIQELLENMGLVRYDTISIIEELLDENNVKKPNETIIFPVIISYPIPRGFLFQKRLIDEAEHVFKSKMIGYKLDAEGKYSAYASVWFKKKGKLGKVIIMG
ncbi:MAG: hypothetical protein GXO43_04920, partial [Crenarchaeota archaeon]|nr:hypothetical protein [Thermoproteota archaeon]